MIIVKRRRSALVVILVLVLTGWFGIREVHCKLRAAAFSGQVESIKQAAAGEIKIGSSKAEVVHFFEKHKIPFKILEDGAYGALQTEGCSPLGCGTDRAFISVQVKLDAAGTVTEAPKIFGMYQDCL